MDRKVRLKKKNVVTHTLEENTRWIFTKGINNKGKDWENWLDNFFLTLGTKTNFKKLKKNRKTRKGYLKCISQWIILCVRDQQGKEKIMGKRHIKNAELH